MARPDLEDEFDKDEFVDEFGGEEPEAPWHNSTRAVVGASAAGVAVIGVLVAAVMFVSGQDEPNAPVTFSDPSFSETASATSATTTTATITSTPKVSTTEINGPPPPPPGSGTSGSSTTTSGSESSIAPPFTRPRPREDDGDTGGPTSRKPRFNITRTLGPGPLG